ncbi:MAG TPA: hypothetical protein VFD13_05855 [Candidatus Kapabacteria bacterium]|nr:hypothetical protein [Candidatus Kapabacteria bacterium]
MWFDSMVAIVVRSTVVYLVILAGFRLAGKRHISQLSLVDFALILLVSNAVQNAMVGGDTSLLGGIVAATTLILINVLLTKFLFRETKLGRIITGEPRLLVRNGQYIIVESTARIHSPGRTRRANPRAWIQGYFGSENRHSRNGRLDLDPAV